MNRVYIGLAVLACLVASSGLSAADRSWTVVEGAHFSVISDGGEKTARAIMSELEQIRAAVKTTWSWARVDVDRPIVVLAPRDENGMKALAPKYWEDKDATRPVSVFVTGPDRYYIALRADAKATDTVGINPYRSAYWSYVALVLRSSARRELPLWLSLGLTEVMSNTIIRDRYVEIGRAIPWHVQRLREAARLPVRELLTIDRSSPWFQQGGKRPDLDARAWAVVHYLMFADEGRHRPALDRFAALALEGKPATAAAEQSFGDLEALETGFATYASRQIFGFVRIEADAQAQPEALAPRTLSAVQAALVQARFHAAMNRPVEARRSSTRRGTPTHKPRRSTTSTARCSIAWASPTRRARRSRRPSSWVRRTSMRITDGPPSAAAAR